MDAFNRLSIFMNWNAETIKEKKKEFNLAVMKDFDRINMDKLETLQLMIQNYSLRPFNEIPTTKAKCKKILQEELFVNIYDFLSMDYDVKFNSAKELAKYSYDNDKIFPKKSAKANLKSKILLRFLR